MIINRFESSGSGGGEIIIDITPIVDGTEGRILFDGAGNVVSESPYLSFDATQGTIYSFRGIIGESDGTPYPNTQLIVSQNTSGDSHSYNMGIVGEATAEGADTTIWGIGVYGGGSTNGATRSAGVLGDGRVTNTADSGSAVGVRGYATNSHNGGLNIGIYAEASASAIGNYALYMNDGNIFSNVAQTWTMASSTAALNIDAGTFVIDTTNNYIGIGATGPVARLDLRAQGALSTDIVQRWRNSSNSTNIGQVTGDGAFTIGTYTNPSTKLSIVSSGGYGIYTSGATGLYSECNQAGTIYGFNTLARSTTAGGTSYGIKAIADGGGATGINFAGVFGANGSGTNYAGYFDSVNGTSNYALYVQRGDMVFGVSPTLNKIGFWNATPIAQPTTAVAAATFAANTSGIANDTATFDGYTIGQVVKALRNAGLLA